MSWLLAKFTGLTTVGKIAVALATLVCAGFVWYGVQGLRDTLHAGAVDKRDAAHDTNVNQALKEAETHGDNANSAAAKRQAAEEQITEAQARRNSAAKNSQAAKDRQASAQRDYDKATNNSPNPDTDRVLTDEELCAELQKLKPPRPCRQE